MNKMLALLLAVGGMTLQGLAVTRVSVEQLEEIVKASRDRSDADVARQLSTLELTERLSSVKLSSWKASLPGINARQALVALADVSAILDPPATDVPTDPPPDSNAQRRMLSLAVDYANKTISKLPDFFATRSTVLYEELPQNPLPRRSFRPPYRPKGGANVGEHTLYVVRNSKAKVFYREGAEVVDSEATKHKASKSDRNLIIHGIFGPILSMVILDASAAHSLFTWSHWELGPLGSQAKFRFVVPEEKSHYEVTYCCFPFIRGPTLFQRIAGYRGEIVIDPSTGAILRLALQAVLNPDLPVVKFDTAVEYGPVMIGGKTYICPVKSISLLRARTVSAMDQLSSESASYVGPLATTLTDYSFDDYHVFRSESRILPEYTPVPLRK